MPDSRTPHRVTTAITCGLKVDRQYLTGMDLIFNHTGTPVALVYPHGLDAQALQHSLAATLQSYPVFTGRLKSDADGHVYIDGQDQGLRFVVTQHDTALPAYGVQRPMGTELLRYATRILPWRVVDHDQPLFVIEVHQFACGGAILTLTGCHSICDGAALWTFFLDWVRVHGGHAISPPTLDRNAVIAFSQAQMQHPYTQGLIFPTSKLVRWQLFARHAWLYLRHIDKAVFRIRADQISQWKQAARERDPQGDALASHDLVTAYCMQRISSRMRSDSPRYMGVVTDLRYRRGLGIPRKYVGNGLGQDKLILSAQELAQDDLATLARKCRVPLEGVSQEALLGYLGFMEQHRQQHSIGSLMFESGVQALHAGVILNNCAHFPIYKLDFGTGTPSWCDNERAAYRKLMIAAAPSMDGSLDVHLSAPRHELAAFQVADGHMVMQADSLVSPSPA
jgi:shikimate O-hydroxycinnamoyltransferase